MRAGFREEDSIGNFTNFREREMAKQRPIELQGKLPKRKKNCRNIRRKCGLTRARLPMKPPAKFALGIRGQNMRAKTKKPNKNKCEKEVPKYCEKEGTNDLYHSLGLAISSALIDVLPELYVHTVSIDRLKFERNRRLRTAGDIRWNIRKKYEWKNR